MFNVSIIWDRLRYGEFPEGKLLKYGFTVSVFSHTPFVDRVEVYHPSTENHTSIAFELGRLIESIVQ